MKVLKYSVYSALFIICLYAVFIGQRKTDYSGLLIISAGIVGLIILLWIYNRNYAD